MPHKNWMVPCTEPLLLRHRRKDGTAQDSEQRGFDPALAAAEANAACVLNIQ